MITTQGCVGRFMWERSVRQSELAWHLKSFLLLLATYMDADGSNCRPSAPELCAVTKRSRQRVFEWIRELEAAGWLRSVARPGKATLRVPRLPDAQAGDPSDTSYGSDLVDPSDGSDGSEAETIHTRLMGLTHPSDPSDTTKSVPSHCGGAPPPHPRRTADPHAGRRTDPEPEPDSAQTPATQLEQESPVPSAARASSDRFELVGTGALRSIGTKAALDELARRKTVSTPGRMSWRGQRAATAHLDPEKRAEVRADLEARQRRAGMRVVPDSQQVSGSEAAS
ncbi:helix-turn-helix domain-containing protein [Streptomyces sp. ID05-26A]|nr:helix-turn-helix domain-containing protein [Streptomyces sp. ID05-26A]